MEQLNLTQEWDKAFPKSDKVMLLAFGEFYRKATSFTGLTMDIYRSVMHINQLFYERKTDAGAGLIEQVLVH